MRKNIAEDKEKLKEKLEYIGLNLEKIPKFLTEFTPFSFRPLKSYNDTTYKVYKYIDVNNIEILLTPTDRLTNLNEKYKLGEVICKSSWPEYDVSKTIDNEKTIAVQVNGKVRSTIKININDSDDVIKERAMQEENVINHISGKEIVKVIVIKGKIVNIVVK